MLTIRMRTPVLAAIGFILTVAFSSVWAAGDGPDKKPKGADSTKPVGVSDETNRDVLDPEKLVFHRVTVIGDPSKKERIPGSAHFISKEELQEQQNTDIHRIIRRVPGVNIQEEDGYGLRPNIGMRGTGVERSQKTTLMEDGVLIAPAPYTAPAAYYFPTAGRMESFEIRKGSSAIKQGPQTNGGALNMISTSIPREFGGVLNAAFGDDNTRRGHFSVGGSSERFGWVAETFQMKTDGFKELDNNGDTGFDLKDYMVKLQVNSSADSNIYQVLELKLGKTDQFGEETYLGLTDADFSANPNRRYAGSAEDWIDTEHEQYQLRHFIQPTTNLDVTTTVYRNDFFRNWHKLQSVAGQSLGNVLGSPEAYAYELGLLRGEIDSQGGELKIRNNRREYYSQGIQTVIGVRAETGGLDHEFEIGLRYHEDEEDRFQDEDAFQMLNGRMALVELGAPGSQTNRVSGAEAFSGFIQDTITAGAWTFTPGVRYESIDYVRNDYSTADPDRSEGPSRVRENSVTAFTPGLGVDYALSRESHVFMGLHKGFSPPGAGQNPDTKEEESLNVEMGYRFSGNGLNAEVIGFFSDYDNLLGRETLSGGGTGDGDLYNGGQVEVKGLEAVFGYDFGNAQNWGVSLPLHLSYTYTSAEFKSAFETGFADWSPSVAVGDELPYLPENQLFIGLGVLKDNWGVHFEGNYVSEMRTKAGQGPIPEGEGSDSRFVLNISGDYTFASKYKVYANLRNVGDETYIVARRPYGARPGLPRTLLFGVKASF